MNNASPHRRVRRVIIGLVSAGSLVVAASPSTAADQIHETRNYTLANGLAMASTAGANVGGVFFSAPRKTISRVSAADQTGTPVRLRVAQDVNNNFQYGDTGEPVAVGCGVVNLGSSAVAFDPNKTIAVFVSIGFVGCTAAGTTGSISLYTPAA